MSEAYKRASAQRAGAAPRSVQSVAKDFRLHYARYKASRLRAPGMGAFHDFVLAAPWIGKPARKSGRRAFGHAEKESFMEWAPIQQNWEHFKIIARVRWARISADEFDLIGGRREQLLAQIEEVYRVSTTMAQSQLESWQAEQQEPQPGVA